MADNFSCQHPNTIKISGLNSSSSHLSHCAEALTVLAPHQVCLFFWFWNVRKVLPEMWWLTQCWSQPWSWYHLIQHWSHCIRAQPTPIFYPADSQDQVQVEAEELGVGNTNSGDLYNPGCWVQPPPEILISAELTPILTWMCYNANDH